MGVLAHPPISRPSRPNVDRVDNRAEIREFLATRRAKLRPEELGLPVGGGARRVPGLRREEVAVLAGVSIEWYIRLEKGNAKGVSDEVLHAVATALQLDEAERLHLFDLARASRKTGSPARPARPTSAVIRPSVQRILDSMTTAPAIVRNARQDILAANELGRALYAPVFTSRDDPPNLVRFCFLDDRAIDFYPGWDGVARQTAAVLRADAARYPGDRLTNELIGDLATRSEHFRRFWAEHDVRLHTTGTKRFQHPLVGYLELTFESLPLPTDDDRGLVLTCCTAEPGSPAADALQLLASWITTQPTAITQDSTDAP